MWKRVQTHRACHARCRPTHSMVQGLPLTLTCRLTFTTSSSPKKDLQCLCGMATIISDDGLEKQSLFCFAASLTCTKSCEGLGIPNGCQLLHRFNQTVQPVLQAGCHA